MSFFDRPDNIVSIGVFGVPIVFFICYFLYQAHKVRYDHDLKRSMIERGMSAEEIEKVIKAQADSPMVKPPKK